MARRFTQRKNGRRMTTVPVALHLSEEVVAFVADSLGLSMTAAAERLAKEVVGFAQAELDWRAPCIETGASGDPRLTLRHTDDLGERDPVKLERDGILAVFAEPAESVRDLILSRR